MGQVHERLWQEVWSTWKHTAEAHRISSLANGFEESVDVVGAAQNVPRDRGSRVITAAPGGAKACSLPRPKHVSIEQSHSSMEQLLSTAPGEESSPIGKPHQLQRTGHRRYRLWC